MPMGVRKRTSNDDASQSLTPKICPQQAHDGPNRDWKQ